MPEGPSRSDTLTHVSVVAPSVGPGVTRGKLTWPVSGLTPTVGRASFSITTENRDVDQFSSPPSLVSLVVRVVTNGDDTPSAKYRFRGFGRRGVGPFKENTRTHADLKQRIPTEFKYLVTNRLGTKTKRRKNRV